MEALKLLFAQRRHYFGHFIRRQPVARLVTICLFFIVFGSVAWAIYLFLLNGFSYIDADTGFADAVTLYVHELFGLVLLFLVVSSAALTSIFTLFQGRKDAWIFVTPQANSLFIYRAITATFASIWPVLLLSIPATLAATPPHIYGWGAVLFGMTIYTTMNVSAIVLTLVAVLCCAKLFGAKLRISRLAICIVFIGVVVTALTWQWTRDISISSIYTSQQLASSRLNVTVVASHFAAFPSQYAALALYQLQRHVLPWALLGVLLLFCIGSLILLVASIPLFAPVWQSLSEGAANAASSKSNRSTTHKSGWLSRATSSGQALFAKEINSLLRDKRNSLWLVFLLLIWVFQTALLKSVGPRPGADSTVAQQAFIQAAQLIVSLYFVATLSLRFAFPSFSMEGRFAWIMASSPVDMRRLFMAKFVLFSSILSFVGLVIGIGNGVILHITGSAIVLSLCTFVTGSICLIAVGLTVGVSYPSFDTDDPQLLSTTLPGLLLTVISIGYGALLGLAVYRYALEGSTLPIACLLSASFVAIPLFIWIGTNKVQTLEFNPTTAA